MKRFVAAACAVLLLTGCGASSTSDTTAVADEPIASTPTVPAVQEHTLTVGENSGSEEEVFFPVGSQVELTLVNPRADDEMHLHGYDLDSGPMKKGEPAVIAFTADRLGDFEVESHETGELLLTVHVVEPTE